MSTMSDDSSNPNEHEEIRTGLEREINTLEKRLDSEKQQLRSKLRQLGINAGRQSLEDVNINPQQFMIRQNGYGYMQAKRARSTQNNLQTTKRRLKRVRERHESIKEQRQRKTNDSSEDGQ